MPTSTETIVDGYGHCVEGRCPGNQQERLRVVRVETSWTYRELGGDLNGVERSRISHRFADPADVACEHCGGFREAAEQQRPVYKNVSGYDPNWLIERQAIKAA